MTPGPGRSTSHPIPVQTIVLLSLATSCFVPAASLAAGGKDILEATGVRDGLIVHLDCGNGKLTAELGAAGRSIVRGLDADQADVDAARAHVRSKGLYGRVSVDRCDGKQLPFVDNLVTLLVDDAEGGVPPEEMLRVLHPHGVLVTRRPHPSFNTRPLAGLAGWHVGVKRVPDEIDEWPHYLRAADNNAVAHDTVVGPPRHMQFLADPLWSRHHDRLASFSAVVTAKGRLFYVHDRAPVFDPDEPGRWFVTARNAFNGALLWRKPMGEWTNILRSFRSGPVQLQRLLVTDGNRVFVTLGLNEPVTVLDAASGETQKVLAGSEKVEEFVHDRGVLYMLIGEEGAEHALIERRTGKTRFQRKLLKAIEADSGKTRWRWPAEESADIMPRTLAVSDGKVFFQEAGTTVCLTAHDGKKLWRADTPGRQPDKAKDGKRKSPNRSPGWTFATLVVKDGVALSCDGKTLFALDARDGRQLWKCPASTPFSKTPSVDILVINGLVWLSPGLDRGRNLKTGKVEIQNNLREELITAGHHHRCYRNKGTDRYVIEGWRGLEFRDTRGEDNIRHNWIRGICQYGIMPANGLLYIPPHNCGCYPEAKLFGLWALKAAESTLKLDELKHNNSLEKGPAYGALETRSAPPAATDWPMHRHDPARSGVQPSPVTAETVAWSVHAGRRLSAPVIARNTLLVSAPDNHQVLAYDSGTGETKWSFTAGGPVDSPPTIHGEAVLFGSADGHVYCLRLSDGELAWRFRAAPQSRSTLSLEQVESLWPVHGSVLVTDGTAYFTAGRSSHLDGGLFLYGLDPLTGEVRHKGRINSPQAKALKNTTDIKRKGFSQNATDFKTNLSPDHSDAFSMTGNISDILVARDDAIYLRHQKLTRDLKPANEWTHHLFSTSTLLDDNESYRAHWFYGNGDFSRLPVAYEWLTRGSFGGFASPLGKFLVFDKSRLWGAGWQKLELYTTRIANIDDKLAKDFPKNPKIIQHQPLAKSLPIHPRAMIKAGDVLYLGGYPKAGSKPHLYGEPITDKGLLLQIDAASGNILSEIPLPACPMFDAISAANGKLYLSLENNTLTALK